MKVLIAGDFCPQQRVAELFNKEEYNEVLGEIKPDVCQVDYSIVNFECPICVDDVLPIEKKGPNLRCTENGVSALKWVGFSCVCLANNHFLDYGSAGVQSSLRTFTKHEIDMVGGGSNIKEASAILYKEICGRTLAVINCCEHEFSIATETTAGTNPLNPIQQYYSIKEAQKNADYVLVIVHGGHEHFQLPSPRMQETYRFFIDAGADVVVNHHQHCFSGYEIYHDRPIFYGLGNFCFDNSNKRNGIWTEGYMVELLFGHVISFRLIPYRQCDEEPKVRKMDSNAFDLRISELNRIINDPRILTNKIEEYYLSCKSSYNNILEPLYNRYYLAFKRKGWLPSFIGKKRKLTAVNYVCCESHRDKLIYSLNH